MLFRRLICFAFFAPLRDSFFKRGCRMRKNLRTVVVAFAAALLIALLGMHTASYAESEFSGKVAESMNSGGYTYILLEKDEEKTWIAVPQMRVVKGQAMSFKPVAELNNFKSTTLNRTFKKIVFAAGPADRNKK